MKPTIYLLLCLLLFSCSNEKKTASADSTSKTIDTNVAVSSADTIAEIKKPTSIAEIKSNHAVIVDLLAKGKLDSVAYQYDCQGERRGTVTYYSHQDQLVMVKHNYAEYDHHSASDQYFVADNSLYFTYLSQTLWSFESGAAAEGATRDDITEKRTYIVDEQPIQCLEKKYSISSTAKDNPNSNAIPNKHVTCKSIEPLLKQYKQLIAFKDKSNHDCLEK